MAHRIGTARSALFVAGALATGLGCSSGEPLPGVAVGLDGSAGGPVADAGSMRLVLDNHGGDMEGHTPRGFEGMEEGLFAGDDINADFPPGDGVQFFLTFDLGGVSGSIGHAELRSFAASTAGQPFEDLGSLIVEEMRFDTFSASLFDAPPEPDGFSCVFASSVEGPFACDVTDVVERSLADGHPYAQFRLRLEQVSDEDGEPDLVAFFLTDADTNEPGIFELEITR